MQKSLIFVAASLLSAAALAAPPTVDAKTADAFVKWAAREGYERVETTHGQVLCLKSKYRNNEDHCLWPDAAFARFMNSQSGPDEERYNRLPQQSFSASIR